MSNTVIKVENLSKYYRLGLIGSGTIREDLDRWIAKLQGKPDPLLSIDQVDHGNRKGDQIWALKNINFEVKRGEILGIIGRNGAGKSTLLKVLSRITAPTTGRITIKGRVGSLLEVGTGFHPELTGRENIYLNGTILGMKKVEVSHKLDDIVEFAEMSEFIDTPAKRYSSGMRVRLAFAVAAYLEPEILIIDEVLAVGDAEFQKKCLGKMKDVSRQGRTVLFVSHNMGSISRLCTRAISINRGEICDEGTPSDVVGKYLSFDLQNMGEKINMRSFANGNRLIDVQIRNGSDEKVNTFDFGQNAFVFIEYSLTGNKARRALAVRVSDMFGNDLFTSWDKDWFQEKPQSGLLKCKLPASFLRPGNYKLKVMLHELTNQSPRILGHVDKLFSITDLNFTFNPTRAGLVAPVLEWSTVEAKNLSTRNSRP